MAILPTDIIIHEILTRLPVTSLLRFKCVSKSYNALISSPDFIDLHLRRSHSSDSDRQLILMKRNGKHLYLLDVDSPDPASSVLKLPLPYALDELSGKYVSVLSSFNGLLCVGLRNPFGFKWGEIILINPCMRVYRSIPRANCTRREKIFCRAASFGLCFDDINNDYKLVWVSTNLIRLDPFGGHRLPILNREVTVYSLKENTWKLVEDVDYITDLLIPRQNGVVLKNHLLHWLFLNDLYNTYHIWCFDARLNEWANEVPLIDLLHSRTSINIGVVHGCLCFSTRAYDYYDYPCEVVWMMKEYGVKESWVKLFNISVATTTSVGFIYPFGVRKGSNRKVLMQENASRGRLFWCETSPANSSNLRRTEEIEGVPEFDKAYNFKGSIVAIHDGHQIKESTDQSKIPVS